MHLEELQKGVKRVNGLSILFFLFFLFYLTSYSYIIGKNIPDSIHMPLTYLR